MELSLRAIEPSLRPSPLVRAMMKNFAEQISYNDKLWHGDNNYSHSMVRIKVMYLLLLTNLLFLVLFTEFCFLLSAVNECTHSA
jgi:hypothetical protein